MSEIVIFEDARQPVEVRLEGETLWATQGQMADLFDTSTDNIGLHLKNIYSEGELDESATTEESSVVRQEGNRQVRRRLKHYNLDAVISVGYRVSSRRATRFRQWATRVLREHLTQGYSLNEHRLAQQGLTELEQAVELLGQTLTRQELVSDLGQEVVSLILGYARTWRLLQDYDENALGVPPAAAFLAVRISRMIGVAPTASLAQWQAGDP
ncbi:virulence RhuM family protein [Halomonas faecis]|uniref:virulence RhuM family protein n=1 Tax=Halomonas faecis TaxID=1562110 RepID=UPI001969C3E9|nr:RhuM family protein [Halomonas faecis]